jgi:hypothetical protein
LPGYTPSTVNVSDDELRSDEPVQRHFELVPSADHIIALENDPEVHHLGDDEYSGRINSQFQKRSEGLTHTANFDVTPSQLAQSDGSVTLTLLARGAQRNNQIFLNGRRLDFSINHSPRDGSFGELSGTIPVHWFNDGRNLLEIRSVRNPDNRSDHDDFEFVNVQLELPMRYIAPPNPQPQRSAARRADILRQFDDGIAIASAIDEALAWLAVQQQRDGHWTNDVTDQQATNLDIGITSLVVLNYLGNGHTHHRAGPYRDVLNNAVEWLLDQQDRRGSFMGDESLLSHAAALYALSEAYGMTGDQRLREPIQRAVRFSVDARGSVRGGWRYVPGQDGDTLAVAWQVLAMHAAHRAGFEGASEGLTIGRNWLRVAQAGNDPHHFIYQPGEPPSDLMTLQGWLIRSLASDDTTMPPALVDEQFQRLPTWDDPASSYHWQIAAMTMQRTAPNDDFDAAYAVMASQILDQQITDGADAGSWPATDQWSQLGGRVFQTALCLRCLQSPYRHAR